ncbi:MAG: anthranilate phosphoribosyltransferase, partial [Marinilabiliaceae bacterium]|nr:anthranilate phosphoribosyltransferase [Marinilabiliaceae bacterium]
ELLNHKTLTREQARTVLINIARESYNQSEVVAFLTVFMMRQVTVEELSGFRDALLELCLRVDLSEFNTIDVCGTGGDGKDTFNISTLASFVVAGAGAKVAKHGNYGVSSSCGSSNVMEYLGYQFTRDVDLLRRQLDQAGICFFHAPLFHPAMKAVGSIRRDLGLKTFFNMLGPMVNPSFPQNQLVGVFSLVLARLYNYIYQQTDKNYTIIHSLDGYDEVSLTGNFKAISNGGEQLYGPGDLNLKMVQPEQIGGGETVEASAKIFKAILNGEGTEAQNSVVIANAAMALKCYHPQWDLEQSLEAAKDSLLSGRAGQVLKKLLENK